MSSVINCSLVYGATAAGQLTAALAKARGELPADTVVVPTDLLALWLTTAHSAGRVEGMAEINRLRAPC